MMAVVVPAAADPVPEPVVVQYAYPAIAAISASPATTAATSARFFPLVIFSLLFWRRTARFLTDLTASSRPWRRRLPS